MGEENVQKVEGNNVIDKGQSKLSDLWLEEDHYRAGELADMRTCLVAHQD